MTRAKRILFVRRFLGRTGGHVTVRDYFMHSLEHPYLDPFVYFTPDSVEEDNDLWKDVPASRRVHELSPADYDILFVGSYDRKLLAGADVRHPCVLNAILHVRHARVWRLRRYLRRPAFRLCNSEPVRVAIEPLANGVVTVIPNGVDTELFRADPAPREPSVLILGMKRPRFARRLARALQRVGVPVEVQMDSVPRTDFASRLRRVSIFVPLPNRTEGFYRPALEGMACGCAVVCPDVVGNRDFSVPGHNCLQPAYESTDQYVAAVRSLIDHPDLTRKLSCGGLDMAARFTVRHHRERYYSFLERHVLEGPSRPSSRLHSMGDRE